MGSWTVTIRLTRGASGTPRKLSGRAGKAISHSDLARQTPELLSPGKDTKRRPNQICASEGFLSAEPEWLRPERCMKPRAGLRRFPGGAI